MVQKPCRIKSICFCFCWFFFCFPFRMNLLSIQKHWVRYYMVRQSYKIGSMLHVKLDLNVLIRFYISRFDYRWIGSDLQRSGAAWLGQEVSSGVTLATRAARLQLALRARGTRLWLARACSFYFALQKIYEFIHDNCKKYMNSCIIWIHICMNSYILSAKNIWIHTQGTPNYIWRSDSKPLKLDLRKSDITWQLE